MADSGDGRKASWVGVAPPAPLHYFLIPFTSSRPFSAGSALAKAGAALGRAEGGDKVAAARVIAEAAGVFHSLGKLDRAAQAYTEAGDLVESEDPEQFEAWYEEAIGLLEAERTSSRAGDYRRRMIARQLASGALAKARTHFLGLVEVAQGRGQTTSAALAALSVVILDLALHEPAEARQHFATCFSGLYGTAEAKTAELLLRAVESADAKSLDAVRARPSQFAILDPHLNPLIQGLEVAKAQEATLDDVLAAGEAGTELAAEAGGGPGPSAGPDLGDLLSGGPPDLAGPSQPPAPTPPPLAADDESDLLS